MDSKDQTMFYNFGDDSIEEDVKKINETSLRCS